MRYAIALTLCLLPTLALAQPDYSDQYNTPIPEAKAQAYASWLAYASKTQHRDVGLDMYDYDIQGAWLAGEAQDYGHMTDRFKKPNHPTFSNQSQYHKTSGCTGGVWLKTNGKDLYAVFKDNMLTKAELAAYFRQVEPDAILLDPRN